MKLETKTKWMIFLCLASIALIVLYFFSRQTLLSRTTTPPSPTPLAAASGNIIITYPTVNQAVGQNFRITGKVRVGENMLSVRVVDQITGKVYLQTSAQSELPDTSKQIDFAYDAELKSDQSLRSGDRLNVEVFLVSPKDGQVTDKVTIPVQFTPSL